jgi:hypothetical protein
MEDTNRRRLKPAATEITGLNATGNNNPEFTGGYGIMSKKT